MTSERTTEAEVACEELAGALKAAGITLPSLCVDVASYRYEQPRALIELGRCNLDTTHKLIAVLKRAAGEADR